MIPFFLLFGGCFFCTCRWCIARIRIANEENNRSGTCWSVTSVVTKKNLRTANGIKRRTMSGLCDQWTLLTNYSISLLSFQLAVCCIRVVVVVDSRSHFRYVRQIIIIQLCRATTWHKNEKCLSVDTCSRFPYRGKKKEKEKTATTASTLLAPTTIANNWLPWSLLLWWARNPSGNEVAPSILWRPSHNDYRCNWRIDFLYYMCV